MLAADIQIFQYWTFETFAQDAVWINPYGAHIKGSNKILQAQTATRVGLNTPQFIFTSNPDDIKHFVSSGPTVFKPISRHCFDEPGIRVMCSRIGVEHIPPDEQLSMQPCYLQREIEKRAEWRVYVLGSELIALRQAPRDRPSHVDWNLDRGRFDVEELTLPNNICSASLNLVRALGLRFGVIDFIEDDHGDLHFLEVNQMGRFLWFDEILPEARVTQRFSSFILNSARHHE